MKTFATSIAEDFGNGGVIDGDVTIGGDLTVTGDSAIATNEVIQGTSIIDITDAEAFLVRKNGDTGDILIVDTANNQIEMYNKVGINTTPSTGLHVKGANDNSNGQLKIESTGSDARIHFINSSGDSSTSGNADILMSATSGYEGLRFMIDGSDKVIIDENGRVGIGIVAPSNALHINHNSSTSLGLYVAHSASEYSGLAKFYTNSGNNTARSLVEIHNDNASSTAIIPLKINQDANGTAVEIQGGDGTTGAVLLLSTKETAVVDNDVLGRINFQAPLDTGVDSDIVSASIHAEATATFSDTVNATDLVFSTGASEVATEKMRLSSDGVFTTSKLEATSSNFKYMANGSNVNFLVNTSGTTVTGTLDTTGKASITTATTPVLNLNKTGGGVNAIHFEHAGVDKGYIYVDASENMKFGNATTNPTMTIDAAGLVGIGHTPTAGQLSVLNSSTSVYTLQLQNNAGGGGFYMNQNAPLASTKSAFTIYSADAQVNGSLMFLNMNEAASTAPVTSIDNNGLGKSIYIDHDTSGTGASDATAMHIDYDRTVAGSGTAAHNDIGIDLDVTSASLGTSTVKGMDIDVVGAASGNSTATGLDVSVSGADTNYAAIFSGGNVGIGTTVPVYPLSIVSANNSASLHLANGTNSDGGNTNEIFVGSTAGSHWHNLKINAYEILFNSAGATKFKIDANGATVTGNLSIDSNSFLKFGTDNSRITGDNNALFFQTASATRLKLDDNSRISLSNNDTGVSNTIFGKTAGDPDGAGDQNVFIGELAAGAGTQTDDADNNVGIGWSALTALTTGTYNTIVGASSADALLTGTHNVTVGANALGASTAGHFNIAIGSAALYIANHTSNDGSIAIGRAALSSKNLASGDQFSGATIAIGHQALTALTTGAGNTAIGYEAAGTLTTGANNTAIGKSAMSAMLGGAYNIAIGSLAMATYTGDDGNNAGTKNIAIGISSMEAFNGGTGNVDADTRFDRNIALGYNSFRGADFNNASVVVTDNIAIGDEALNSTGVHPQLGTIAIGSNALTALTSGIGNTAIGYTALAAQSVGNFNTAIGYQALAQSTKTGTAGNTAVGYKAGYACVAAGYANTFIGINAGVQTTAGSNTIIGAEAGDVLTTGIGNTIIGATADPSAAGGRYQIVIGNAAVGVANNSATIGDASITDVYMAQDSGAIVHSGALVNGLSAILLTTGTLAYATHTISKSKYVTVSADAQTITLPAVQIGAVFIIVNIAADGAALLTIEPNANDKFLTDIAGGIGTDDKGIINTQATQNQGDFVKLVGLNADGWLIDSISGTWVDES